MLQINGNITQLIKLADILKPLWIKSRRQNKFCPSVCLFPFISKVYPGGKYFKLLEEAITF